MFMFLTMFVLAFLIAIPNALAGRALLDGITLLAASRTHLGRVGPTFCVWLGTVGLLSCHRFAEGNRIELLSGRRCTVLFS